MAKKKIIAPKVVPQLGASDKLRSVAATMQSVAGEYRDFIATLTASDICPQSACVAAHLAGLVAAEGRGIRESFDTFALAHRANGGAFDLAPAASSTLVLVTFAESAGKVTPRWKDEYMALAKQVANLRGESFDEEREEAAVRARYQPGKPSQSVKLVEAGA